MRYTPLIKIKGVEMGGDWSVDFVCTEIDKNNDMEVEFVLLSADGPEYLLRKGENLIEMQGIFKDVELLAYFYNVDAAYWGIMSNYHYLIEEVIQNVSQMKGIEVNEV